MNATVATIVTIATAQQWTVLSVQEGGKMNAETNEEHNSELAALLSTEAAVMKMVMMKN